MIRANRETLRNDAFAQQAAVGQDAKPVVPPGNPATPVDAPPANAALNDPVKQTLEEFAETSGDKETANQLKQENAQQAQEQANKQVVTPQQSAALDNEIR